jgi:hypothetical protein
MEIDDWGMAQGTEWEGRWFLGIWGVGRNSW